MTPKTNTDSIDIRALLASAKIRLGKDGPIAPKEFLVCCDEGLHFDELIRQLNENRHEHKKEKNTRD